MQPARTSGIGERAERRLVAAGIDAAAWANGPGDGYAPHAHDYDKVLVVVEGSITFGLVALGLSLRLRAGDRLDLPAGTVHAAHVGPQGVRCLEGHLPAGVLGPDPRAVADWATSVQIGPEPETDDVGAT